MAVQFAAFDIEFTISETIDHIAWLHQHDTQGERIQGFMVYFKSYNVGE